MIRKKIIKTKPTKIIIDLDGPDGNAFYLLGIARNWAKQIGYSTEEINEMLKDAKSSDYEHLLEVLDKHFGSFVIFERS